MLIKRRLLWSISDICELGHGLCKRIAFVLERSTGPVRKFPKLCNNPNKGQSCPKQNGNLHFYNSGIIREKKAPQGKKYRMINNKSSGMKGSFKYEVYNINAAKTVAWRWAIWLKTILNFFPWTPFPVNDMITNFGFLGRMWTSGTVHCSKL